MEDETRKHAAPRFLHFLGEYAPQTPLGKKGLMAPFLSQPPISQKQSFTELIETPGHHYQ